MTAQVTAPKRNTLRLYALEAKYEFLKLLRLPFFSVATIGYPLLFYLIFGSAFGNFTAGGIGVKTYLLATYGAFGVLAAGLFGFGAGIAGERGQGWLRLKRVSPMPPLAYFVAKIVMALLFSAITILALFLFGFLVYGVQMPLGAWTSLFGTLVVGVFPFAAIGLFFGYLLGPNSAPMVLQFVYLPMAFASGLWMPIEQLPKFIQHLAPFLPAYHYAQLAISRAGGQMRGTAIEHILVLAAYTVIFLLLGVWAYRRDEGKTYG
jgi:ABC-2 type transport system permease protein